MTNVTRSDALLRSSASKPAVTTQLKMLLLKAAQQPARHPTSQSVISVVSSAMSTAVPQITAMVHPVVWSAVFS